MKAGKHISVIIRLDKQRLLMVLLFIAALGVGSLSDSIELTELCTELTEEAESESEAKEKVKEITPDEFMPSSSSGMTLDMQSGLAFERRFIQYTSPYLELVSPPPEREFHGG